ncbi:peptidoglycan DD-metalloendopeptidase family protein [uncultured Eudoraea sp.]|uniref:peptidoglycan DD-metalloendopeptidase family protein n=1 Tax=uncultured Eudoraea sp. TaxID=1035614 RepID=UPI00261AB988|nr:peptidoglycan DD-metalloendopeptidase family protein [uncultured Eudoraea sp.]
MRPVLLLLIFFTLKLFSQDEQPNYERFVSVFTERFNSGDYDGIYDMYDAGMKNAFTNIETRNFYENNINRLTGEIKSMQFYTLREGAHVYRVVFDKSVADLTVTLSPESKINGLLISRPKPLGIPLLERNTTIMSLPFNGEWFVYWGGVTKTQNYHVNEVTQQYAYDIMKVKDGASYEGDPLLNESYFAFGEDIIAPCDARVVSVIDDVPDNIPGEMNPQQLTGNTIVLQTDNDEYLLLAHLMKGSIVVQEGQDIRKGEILAKCGNSGNSTEPHLHLSLQNAAEMEESIGAKLYFDRIEVNGEIRLDYLPVKEDFISNSY